MHADQAEGLRKLLARESVRRSDLAPVRRATRKRGAAETGIAPGDVVLVVSADTPSILGAYAAMKHAKRAREDQTFALLVTGVDNEEDATRIHRNIADAARRYLKADVELIGYLACDAGEERRPSSAGGIKRAPG